MIGGPRFFIALRPSVGMSHPAKAAPAADDEFHEDLQFIQQVLNQRFDPGDISAPAKLVAATTSSLSGALSWNCAGMTSKLQQTDILLDELSERSKHAGDLTDTLFQKATAIEASLSASHATIHRLSTKRLSIAQRIAFSLASFARLFDYFFPREAGDAVNKPL
jgi:hypothetical protein